MGDSGRRAEKGPKEFFKFLLRKLEKQEQHKPEVSRRKKMIKIRATSQ